MIQAIATGKRQPLPVLLVTRRVQESDMHKILCLTLSYSLLDLLNVHTCTSFLPYVVSGLAFFQIQGLLKTFLVLLFSQQCTNSTSLEGVHYILVALAKFE